MGRILLVDDDPNIRELVRYFLTQAGHEVFEAVDGEHAMQKLEEQKADLVVLDIMMPRVDGWELCRLLKKSYHFPILMLSAKGESAQKVRGFDLGADDYMVKPFDPPELVARVKALLKRYKIETSQIVQLGKLSLRRDSHEIWADGKSLTIPLKEFEVLFKLGTYPGKTFSREQLIEDIWGYDFDGTERTVDVHMNRLRERFPESEWGFRITAIRGLGYRLEIVNG